MNSKKPTFQTNPARSKVAKLTSSPFKPSPFKASTGKPNQGAKKNKPQTAPRADLAPKLTGGELQNARKQGTVAVTIKGEQAEKKTGPLSPRAPEKIRKNRNEEMKIYGENACLALFEHRPEAIVRLWTTVQMSHQIGHILSYLAKQKKTYHVVSAQELSKVCGSEHHGGIGMLVKKPTPFTLTGYLKQPSAQDCLVALAQMGNSYNVGGLMRTCALFGVRGLVVENVEGLNSASALRIAEGGREHLLALETPTLTQGLQQLRQAGYQIVHLTQQASAVSALKTRFHDKVVFVISENATAGCMDEQDSLVKIPTTGKLTQQLNPVVAAGILLSHWYSQPLK